MRPSGPYRLSARRCETGAARRGLYAGSRVFGQQLGERQWHRRPIPGARQMGPVLGIPLRRFSAG